ncbi:hypothetical protein IIA16_05305, partial [bacterium]|nr:hypothetical protein [bacterium]
MTRRTATALRLPMVVALWAALLSAAPLAKVPPGEMPSWRNATLLAPAASGFLLGMVSSSGGDGTVAVVWLRDRGLETEIWGVVAPPGGEFGKPARLPDSHRDVSYPS